MARFIVIVAAGVLALAAAAPAAGQEDPQPGLFCGTTVAVPDYEEAILGEDSEGDDWLVGLQSHGTVQTGCFERSSGRAFCIEGQLAWEIGIDGKRRLVIDANGRDGTKVWVREKPCSTSPISSAMYVPVAVEEPIYSLLAL